RGLQAQVVREDHPQACDLGHGEVNEHDAAREHLHAEGHVSRGDEQAGDKRRPQNPEACRIRGHFSAPSRGPIMSSEKPNRSLALSVPPTVKGSITIGIFERSERNRAAWGLLYDE